MMAQRFGGKHSPDGAVRRDHESGPARPDATKTGFGGKMVFYYVSPVPFAIRAFGSGADGLIVGLGAAAVMALAVWMTVEGVRAHAAYDDRRVARRPALPRKIFGSFLTGAGLVLGAQMVGIPMIQAAGLAVIGAGLHLWAFGPDPLRDKGMEGVDAFQTDRVARAVTDAEATLAAMQDAILRANDRGIEARVEKFATAARALFRTIENDPGDLTAARKYLTVYLTGARDAAVKFADLFARTKDPADRADFEALLTDLETQFAARTTTLLTDNRSDLDVEISVLRERLARET